MPALLGERDERAGCNQPVAGMMPAHQRFEAGDVAIDARLWLIVQRKLVARDRRPQILLQGPLLAQLLVHRYFEKAGGPTHLRFRAEQRRIRVRDESRSVDTILRIDADADRESHVQDAAVDFDVAIKRRSQPFCEGLGRGRLGPGRRDDGKFAAAEPRKKGALAGRLEAACYLAQQGYGFRTWNRKRRHAIMIFPRILPGWFFGRVNRAVVNPH